MKKTLYLIAVVASITLLQGCANFSKPQDGAAKIITYHKPSRKIWQFVVIKIKDESGNTIFKDSRLNLNVSKMVKPGSYTISHICIPENEINPQFIKKHPQFVFTETLKIEEKQIVRLFNKNPLGGCQLELVSCHKDDKSCEYNLHNDGVYKPVRRRS